MTEKEKVISTMMKKCVLCGEHIILSTRSSIQRELDFHIKLYHPQTSRKFLRSFNEKRFELFLKRIWPIKSVRLNERNWIRFNYRQLFDLEEFKKEFYEEFWRRGLLLNDKFKNEFFRDSYYNIVDYLS